MLHTLFLLISLLPSAAQAETIRVASISFRPQKLGLSQNWRRVCMVGWYVRVRICVFIVYACACNRWRARMNKMCVKAI